MKCSICNKEIAVKEGGWDSGNNAQPVNDGRCCDECNATVVIPARLAEVGDRQDSDEEEPEHWLYLRNWHGFTSVVSEGEKWSVAYEMTGKTGRLFAAAPSMLTTLRDLRREMKSGSILDAGNIEAWIKELDTVIANAEGRDE